MLRVLPKSEVRETHCRVREKSGKSFLEAWGWTMKIGLDLDIARKGIPGEEVVWERYRGIKPWECSGNNMGESYVRQPLHGYIRQHQAELTEGSKFRKFIFAFWEELRKISQNKSISPILGFLRKTAEKHTLMWLHFSATSVSPSLSASWRSALAWTMLPWRRCSSSFLCPNCLSRTAISCCWPVTCIKEKERTQSLTKCWDGG